MQREWKSWLMLAVLACIWGSSFILMKRGMETPSGEAIYSDTQVASLRMLIAGLIMLPFGVWSLRKIKRPKQVLSLVVVGFSGNFFPAFLFTFAETELSSGLAGMLNSFTPFFTLMIGALFFRQQLKWRQSVGLLLAFCGIVLLIMKGSAIENSGSWYHIGALVLATFMYGLSLNTIKHTLADDFKAWEITALAFTFVAVPAGCAAFFTGTFSTMQTNEHAWDGLGYIAVLSIMGTCLALLIFNRIIALTSAVFASSVTYFIPFVAVALGAYLNHESFHWLQLVAMLVVLAGVYLAGRAK
jgi:drug/metabolite transporter (DMT)-like permease